MSHTPLSPQQVAGFRAWAIRNGVWESLVQATERTITPEARAAYGVEEMAAALGHAALSVIVMTTIDNGPQMYVPDRF